MATAKSHKGTSDKFHLDATVRTVFGKNLKKLRHQGVVPANVFGPGYKSKSVTVPLKEFSKIYKLAEETGIIYLKIEKEEVPVLIRGAQRHPVSHLLLHIDFRKIDLKQKMETEVPVKTIGDSEAVNQKGGVLLTQSHTVLIESLPEDIPHEIEVDISSIKEIGGEIKVADLTKSDKYTVKDDPEKVLVSVIAHKEESLVAETTAAEVEITTEVPKEGEEAEATEGKEEGKKEEAKPAEGKKDEGKKEEAKKE